MGWVMAGLGFHGLDMPKFIRPMTHPSSGPPRPSPFPARPIGLGQGSAMGWWAEPKPMRTIVNMNEPIFSNLRWISFTPNEEKCDSRRTPHVTSSNVTGLI